MTTIEQAIALAVAEHSRPQSMHERAIELASQPMSRANRLDVLAHDHCDAQRKAEAFSALAQIEPIGPTLAALVPLSLADHH